MLIKQVEYNLLNVNGIDVQFLERMKAKLMNRGVDFCDLYLQNSSSESFNLDEGIIKGGHFSIDQGIGIRAISGEKTFMNYSNSLNPKTITNLIDGIFIEPAVSTNSQPVTKLVNDSFIQSVPPIKSNQIKKQLLTSLYTADSPIDSHSAMEKIELLNKINQWGRSFSHVTNVIASISMEYDEICILNNNAIHSDIRPLIHLSITIIITKDGKIEKGSQGGGGRFLLNQFDDETVINYTTSAYEQALLKSEAVAGPAGKMPVVLGNAWAGVILHEAIGHGLEGDFNRKGSSAFSNRIGQQVASSGVTVIDEGCIPNRRGSLHIDDEGNPTQKTVLIENGILCGYMFDELNAKLMGTKSTGNGRRESFNCSPMPRMTNTYMLGGKYAHEEIIASIDNGLYAENFSGGQVDITSGQFVFNANVAWVIKNGKLSHPVKGCALVGNGPECLKYVSMVGNNYALDSGVGSCGKSGQTVPVGVGQPTIRIDDGLVVGG